ncbi:MAG TPA: (4Fe-4S)-binding protein [Bacteroidales bacterium]|jgi:uncharacterized Fe-S cluster protein YjdI|nr:(4Fe-4S)-binding protein [Bacteroidales bacterium]
MKREHLLADGKRTITWNGNKCMHKAFCLKGIVTITDKEGLTIHNISSAQYKALVNQVKTCPSGALAITGINT